MLPIVTVMSRYGLVALTAIITLMSALLSTIVAWVFSFVIDVPNYNTHMLLAFAIPFVVTPILSLMSSLSIRDLQTARRHANEMALMDPLTGIANRRAFFGALARRADPTQHTAGMQGVLFIDIDHFKAINDRWGHAAGDAVLKDFAGLLAASVRERDLFARIGGEEFVVHVMDAAPGSLAAIAAGIGAKLRSHTVAFEDSALRYTVSIGVASGSGARTIDELLAAADRALYTVKNSGRDGYSVAALDTAEPAAAASATGSPLSRRNDVRVA